MGLPYRDENVIETGANGLGKWQITRNPAGEILRVEQYINTSPASLLNGATVIMPINMPDDEYFVGFLNPLTTTSVLFYAAGTFTVSSFVVAVRWYNATIQSSITRMKITWIKGA